MRYHPVLQPGVFYRLSLHQPQFSPLLCVQSTNVKVLRAAIKCKSRYV